MYTTILDPKKNTKKQKVPLPTTITIEDNDNDFQVKDPKKKGTKASTMPVTVIDDNEDDGNIQGESIYTITCI